MGLAVNPMHKRSDDGIPCVALSLLISRSSLRPGYIINAVFELSVFNQSNGTYCVCKDSYNFRFKKRHSKEKCLIPLELLKSSDFLFDDTCVFGVTILKADVSSPKRKSVVLPKKPITRVQNLFLQKKEFIEGAYTWTVNISTWSKLEIRFPMFEVGGHKWHISMRPLGNEHSTKSLSLFLHLHDPSELPLDSGVMIELTLSILDQKHGKHYTHRACFGFAGDNGRGWSNFIPLKILKDPSNGYLVGSKCIVKAHITIIGSSRDVQI